MRVNPIIPTVPTKNTPHRRHRFIHKNGITYYMDEAQLIGGLPEGCRDATAMEAASYIDMLIVNGNSLMNEMNGDFYRIYSKKGL